MGKKSSSRLRSMDKPLQPHFNFDRNSEENRESKTPIFMDDPNLSARFGQNSPGSGGLNGWSRKSQNPDLTFKFPSLNNYQNSKPKPPLIK